MATKAELEEENNRLQQENAELQQQLEQLLDGEDTSRLEIARTEGRQEGRAETAEEAARILYEATGKSSPTVKRIRALGEPAQ